MSDCDDWVDDPAPAAPANDDGYRGGNRGGGGGGGFNRGGGGGKGCFKCGEEGHMSRECPQGGGGGGKGCFKCGEEGHMSRECPQGGGGGGGGGTCYNCQQTGHMSRECTNEKVERPRRDGGGGGGGGTCYNCQLPGHMSRDCPNEKVERPGRDGGGGGGTCYNCQQTGHMSRECTNEKVERPRRSDGESGGGGGGKGCFKCGEEGHMSRECPQGGGGGGGGGGNVCFNCQEPGHMSRECTNERKPRPTENGAEGGDEKPREQYCPAETTMQGLINERKENWKGTGINFSKYKKIAVKVTGENVPAHVEKFEDMGLRPLVLENVNKIAGYTEPTPIQKYGIPIILNGRDLMACAQTGSGKTGAYLLPIITHLLNVQNTLDAPQSPAAHPYVLILAPTRELAIQIHKEGNIYANESIIKVKVVYGGTQTGHAKRSIENGCHILVATPGRLKQFIRENVVSLERLMFFVLDEADRMLDMGFKGDIEEIFKTVPKGEVKTALFSATFPEDIQAMAASFLKNYLFVTVGTVGGACSDVEQSFLEVPRSEKRDAVLGILKEMDPKDKVLIFVGTKKGADFLAAALSRANISATSIHGDRLQSQRETALREFTSGRHKILVATAVAARGLDIPQVTVVINYDLPTEIDEYVHRIGRTGRVGHTGRAVSLFDPESPNDPQLASKLIGILKGAGQEVPEFLGNLAGGGGFAGFASSDIRKGPANVEASTGGDDEWD